MVSGYADIGLRVKDLLDPDCKQQVFLTYPDPAAAAECFRTCWALRIPIGKDRPWKPKVRFLQ